MPDRNYKSVSHEQMRFSIRNLAVDDLGSAGNDKQAFAILFNLGALMGPPGILDCQRVKSELVPQALQ